jgi:hypothetical protein
MHINDFLGKKVSFSAAYKRKASSRMQSKEVGKFVDFIPQPIFNFSGEGFVIGERRVLMGEAKYHYGGEAGQPHWVGGTQEQCWLVTQHIRKEPFLVRKPDATFI